MVTYNIPTNSHVFVFANGVLNEVNIKRIIFTNWVGCDDLQTEFRIESDTLNGVFDLLDMYDSVEDFLAGKECDNITVEPFAKSTYENVLGANRGRENFWYIEDNQVKYLEVAEMKKAYYEYETNRFYSDEFKGREFFPSKEYASKFLDVEVNKADGTTERVAGINRLLMLDSDQRKLIKQFQELTKTIRESGIFLCTDPCGDFYAYNKKNVETLKYACSEDELKMFIKDDVSSYECSGGYDGEFIVSTDISLIGEVDMIYAKRKK